MNEFIPDMNSDRLPWSKTFLSTFNLSSFKRLLPVSSDFVSAITAFLVFCQLHLFRSTFKETYLSSQYHRSRIELPLL
ncbi:hypothetical protein ACSNN5_08690 [Brevibacillus formosus]